MTPTFWIGTSWKMHKTLAEAQAFAAALPAHADPGLQRFVIPPFTVLREVKAALAASSVLVGAQNLHWQDAGAWTGEISAPMLVDCGADMVEIGHSERRIHFGETDETVGLKVAAAVRNGLIPLICIGETINDRDAGRAAEVLARQVRAAFASVAGYGQRKSCWPMSRSGRLANMANPPALPTPTPATPRSKRWRITCWAARWPAFTAARSMARTPPNWRCARRSTGYS